MKTLDIYIQLKKRIHAFRQNEKRIHMFIALCQWILFAILISFFITLLEKYFWFDPSVKKWILFFVSLSLFVGFISFVLQKMIGWLFYKKHPSDTILALSLGMFIPNLKDQLADALQVYEASLNDNLNSSNGLADIALAQVYEKVKSFHFTDFISSRKLYKNLGITIAAIVFLGSFTLLDPKMNSALHRMLHPFHVYEKPRSLVFHVHPGNVQLVEGDTLKIDVKVLKGNPKSINLFLQLKDENPEKIILKSPYQHKKADLKKPGIYWLESEDYRSKQFFIEILKRPFVHSFQWRIKPPIYTQLKEYILEKNTGHFHALKGSMLSLTLKSTKQLNHANLIWDHKQLNLSVKKDSATGGLRFLLPGEYYFDISDTCDINNLNPIHYQVSLQPDQFPIVQIKSPQSQVELTEQLILPLSIETEDDFGISKMQLNYWIQMPGAIQEQIDTLQLDIPLIQRNQKYILQSYTWDLKAANLFPEDVVYYFVQVTDNDIVSGPKIGRSDIHLARFPSIFEIFQQVEQEHTNQIESFEEQRDESKNLLEALENIERDIKTGQDVTWEEKHELSEAMKKQQEIQKEIQDLIENLQEMVEKMDENQLLDTELFEKYQELQNLYEEIATPELLDAMQKFQDLLQNMKTPDLQKAVEQMKVDQEQMMQSLERTIQLLKRIQTEQKMDEVIQKVDHMMKQQEAVNETLQNKKTIASETERQQEAIHQDFKRWQNDLSDLKEMMSEFQNMPNQEMSQFLDSLQNSESQEMFDQMQQKMQQKDNEGSQEKGEGIRQSLESMKQQLSQMQESMSQKSQQEVAQSFQRISHKLMQASQAQEQLGQKSAQKTDQINDLAKEQQSLQRFTQSISDSLKMLSQKTMGVTPEMFQALSKAEEKMNNATQSLGNRQQFQAGNEQKQAMGALNQMMLAIQQSMNQMSGQSGSGMEQFMNQMNQMTKQQMALNQQLMQMLQQGQLTLGEQAALQRMAGRQKAIQNAMKEMAKQYGSQGEHLGRLDSLIEEMQASIDEMQKAKADRKTLERQEKILSRMLDAQRSVREREYSRKRKGNTGKDIYRQSPEMIDVSVSELRKQIERELLHLSEKGYSEEDQQLIRDYFETLLKEKVE